MINLYGDTIMIRIFLITSLLLPNLVSAFGSATILGMRNEHARITQAALSCESKYDEINNFYLIVQHLC